MAATVGDSSDGDSAGEGELLSPGSSMSSMVYEAADLGATVLPAHNGSSRDRSNSEASSGSAMILRGGGGAPAGTGMATIEEETPGAVQDSPLKSTSQQQQWQRQLSPPRGFQGLLQQQLAEQTSLQGNKSSEWQSGIGSLSQGLGHMVEEALAEPYAEDQADLPQQTQVLVVAFLGQCFPPWPSGQSAGKKAELHCHRGWIPGAQVLARYLTTSTFRKPGMRICVS